MWTIKDNVSSAVQIVRTGRRTFVALYSLWIFMIFSWDFYEKIKFKH